jgi:SAM-dependent methyltransferase
MGKLTSGARGLLALDVETGTGFLAFVLAERGHQVVGIDLSTRTLARVRAKAKELEQPVHFLEDDAEGAGFPDHTFGVVASHHVIWNLPLNQGCQGALPRLGWELLPRLAGAPDRAG